MEDFPDRVLVSNPVNSTRDDRRSMAALLEETIREAWFVGKTIDLRGVRFGPSLPDWPEPRFFDNAFSYYFFLAGLVRTQGCSKILEIGTHFGGSGLAMLKGVADAEAARLLTIDITDLNPELHNIPGLTKLTGDANSEAMIGQVFDHFADEPVDLIYIDTNHSFMPTLLSLGIYGTMLRPRFLVLDDISLADAMRKIWSRLCASYSEAAVNCCDIVPEIRTAKAGFGLIQLR
jgi:hypothetical protein